MEYSLEVPQLAGPRVRSLAVERAFLEWPSPGTTDGIAWREGQRARCKPFQHNQLDRKVYLTVRRCGFALQWGAVESTCLPCLDLRFL